MALITDLPAASNLAASNYTIIDTGSQTQKLKISDAYADATHPGFMSTAAQTFTGRKTFSSSPQVAVTTANSGGLRLSFSDKGDDPYCLLFESYNSGSPTFNIRQFSVDSNGDRLSNHETFIFPGVTKNRSTDVSYNILTTKIYQFTGVTTKDISANSSVSFTITAGSRALLVVSSSYTAARGAYIIGADSSNTYSTDIVAGSGITLTKAAGSLTVASTSTATAALILLKGSAS